MLRTQVVKLARATPSFKRQFTVTALRAAEGDTGGTRPGGAAQAYVSLASYVNDVAKWKLTSSPIVTLGTNESRPARTNSSETRRWKGQFYYRVHMCHVRSNVGYFTVSKNSKQSFRISVNTSTNSSSISRSLRVKEPENNEQPDLEGVEQQAVAV